MNRCLSRCAEVFVRNGKYQSYKQVGLKLIVHAGAGFATSPARRPDDKSVDPRAQWMLSKASETVFKDSQQAGSNLQITVHIWIDETIKAEELDVPDEFEVTLGPELQRLFQKSR